MGVGEIAVREGKIWPTLFKGINPDQNWMMMMMKSLWARYSMLAYNTGTESHSNLNDKSCFKDILILVQIINEN